MLEFDWGSDMEKAKNDVRTNLDLIGDYLPDDAQEPLVLALNPSMMPIMMMSMNAKNLSPAALRTLGDDKVTPLLERVKGVASVSVEGGLKRRINVNMNPVLMASHGLSPSGIATAIQSSAGLVAAGNIRTDVKEYNLRIYSEYRSVDQIRNLIVKPGTVPVRLTDIATVEDGFEEQTADVRINGGQGVAVVISKQSDANTVQTAQAIRKALPQFKKFFPEGLNSQQYLTRLNLPKNQLTIFLQPHSCRSLLLSLSFIFFFRNGEAVDHGRFDADFDHHNICSAVPQ